ncbi:MAG TPA: DALR anticodon-binding domain-containing protein [Intrasporangium sp.]|uniref:DALR anticodon-binding domain-containing protein n=1 Tax=Intrasporangium sp. TaxID=1925024 RepID=UPI002D77EB82|nr:DALR anticodon-binding domain-containing protein [Intrasporangium sp.]HET7399540.1 DALR anticodon-binding domain-containing protein [Intrasporangium sp.]
MTPEQLRSAIADSVAAAVGAGELPPEARGGPPGGVPLRPAEVRPTGADADWVSPVAIRWAPSLRLSPRGVATVLAERLCGRPDVDAVAVVGDGLLALTLSDAARSSIVPAILAAPDRYAAGGLGYVRVPDEPAGSRPPGDPVRRVQLSHARLCRLLRNAAAAGVLLRGGERVEELALESERRLLVALADQPERLARHACDDQELLRAVADLAARADGWTHPLRPARLGEPVLAVHGARVALATAARIVLRNGLARLGASAPERM